MEFDPGILWWLLETCGGAQEGPEEPENVMMLGSGTSPEHELRSLLSAAGVEFSVSDETTNVLVLGRERWTGDRLLQLLDARTGQRLRAYSQEMFVAYLISGQDPLEDPQTALRLAGDHPGLAYLMDVGFDWPSTVVGARGGGTILAIRPELGVLKFMGYAVGIYEGRSIQDRHRILTEVYLNELPSDLPDEIDMAEWAEPRSPHRLEKMANTIATLARNAKMRRSGSWERAISDWEADLEWLRTNFYRAGLKFRWPSTEVG